MSSSINYTLVLLGASLATRFIVPDAHLVTYVGNFVVAFCFYTLCSLVYYRYLYTFYLSPLRDLPLIKVSSVIQFVNCADVCSQRKTWGECLNLITAPTYLEGMNNLDNNGLLRRIDTLNQEVIIITTPEVAAEFFQKKADDYMKWVAMSRILDDMLGHGLLTAEGQDHRVSMEIWKLNKGDSGSSVVESKKGCRSWLHLWDYQKSLSFLLVEVK